MKLADLEFMSQLVGGRIGIVLGREKDYLLDTRLAPLTRLFGLASVAELVDAIRRGDKRIEEAAIEAMTTNETLFFRDKLPFDQFLRVIGPKLAEARPAGGEIRIWCAACASGQEPFSLAMLIDANPQLFARHKISILATDVSSAMIARCKAAVYSAFEVQRGLPQRFLERYFRQDGVLHKLDRRIVDMVQFERLNMLEDFSRLGRFDVIFCRNLLIYFDEERKRQTLGRLAQRLAPDGYFILGAAETVIGLATQFEPHPQERALYVLADRQRPGLRLAAG
jgi:chemotaxis protein methyltransferase CheR